MTQKTTISFSIFPSFLLFRGIDLHGRDSVAFFNVIQFKKPPMMILLPLKTPLKEQLKAWLAFEIDTRNFAAPWYRKGGKTD